MLVNKEPFGENEGIDTDIDMIHEEDLDKNILHYTFF